MKTLLFIAVAILSLSKAADVKINILDSSGRNIHEIVNGNYQERKQTFYWDTCYEKMSKVPGGIYFCHIEATTKENVLLNFSKPFLLR
jgi:flagellar hook assembly protein FlgD